MARANLPLLALLLFLTQTPAQAQTAHVLHTALPGDALAETSALVVDIRQPQEWIQTGVLPNALLLTFADSAQFLAELQPHLQPGQPVLLICRTGNRTARAAAMIAPQLDVPVVDVTGGMYRLIAEGYSPAAPRAAQGCRIC